MGVPRFVFFLITIILCGNKICNSLRVKVAIVFPNKQMKRSSLYKIMPTDTKETRN